MHNHSTFGSLIENGVNSAVMNELSPDDGWIQSHDMSYSTLLGLSSSYFDSADMYMTRFDSNISSDKTDMIKPPYDHHDHFIDDRMIQVVQYLNERCIFDTANLLVQLWVPVIINGKRVLTTMNQHMVNSDNASLSYYIEVSKSYQFGGEYNNSSELMGLPSRVFLNKFPLCTPNLQLVGQGDDPRVTYAQKFNLYGCLILPIFEQDGETCLGVVELVTTSQNINFRDELENIFKALEIVDLKSSDFLIHPKIKDFNEPNEMVLAEIRDILRSICDTLKLPLAQTWGPNKTISEDHVDSISIIESASYVFDPQMLGFFEACSLQSLVQGEGIAGKALGTNQPCFTNFDDFCRADYPLAHQVRMFGLDGSLAIRLHSTYMGSLNFILEFFLPLNCNDHEEQKQMCNTIASMIQNLSWSLHTIKDEEKVVKSSSPDKETNTRDESWISHMLEAQQRGENVVLSMGCHKEEPEEEFQLVNHYYNGVIFSETEKQTYLGWGPESRNQQSINKKSNIKNRSKTERNISLQVLQQYFPGSLKDAAKSIGVCPTTLKRICRQHGIMRWPSRKIKKVSHSLKKLQLVIDSVQGAEGVIQLGAFYTNFPELGSVAQPSPKPKVNKQVNVSKSKTTPSNSSSSCSCGSSCSIGSHKQTKKVNQKETKLVATSESNKLVENHNAHEVIASAPNDGSPISQDENVFRVKASYGDEKIIFKMPKTWEYGLLKRELTTRFNVYHMGNMTIEYIDDESERVLLLCDDDLEVCKEIHTKTKNPTIKLFLHQSSHSAAFAPLILPDDDVIMW